MIRRPPRSTLRPSSAASDVYKRQALDMPEWRETTQQTDWRAKQPSQVACFSEDLKCWEAWDIPVGTKPRISHHWSPGEERCWKRKRWTIFLERTREAYRQSDKQWNRFKDNVGETSERRGGAHTGFSERIDTILTNVYFRLLLLDWGKGLGESELVAVARCVCFNKSCWCLLQVGKGVSVWGKN